MDGLVAVDYSVQHQHDVVRIIRERVTQAQHRFDAVVPTLDAQDDLKNKRGPLYREPVPLGPRTTPARAPSTKTGPSVRARKASAESNSDAPSFRAALDAQRFRPSERPSSSRGVGLGVGRVEHESHLARHERAVEGPNYQSRVRTFGSAPDTRSVSGGGETVSRLFHLDFICLSSLPAPGPSLQRVAKADASDVGLRHLRRSVAHDQRGLRAVSALCNVPVDERNGHAGAGRSAA